MSTKFQPKKSSRNSGKPIVLSSADIQLPADVHMGKKQTNGLMIGGRPVYSSVAQIFLECAGGEAQCHDTIAILPNRNASRDANDIVDSITDVEAVKIFAAHGWLVKGYNSRKYTRCPVCASVLKPNSVTAASIA